MWSVSLVPVFATVVGVAMCTQILDARSSTNEEICYSRTDAAITQGSTIALQALYSKRNWMGCANGGDRCGKDGCPGLFMESSTWTTCWGEVFKIYRQAGPGEVRVGDIVGIYYPAKSGHWFSLSGYGHLAPCPGLPTTAHGFQDVYRWYTCYGEVFKIFAYGKNYGDIIFSNDYVFLCYPHERNWLSLVNSIAHHRSCPGSSLPPPTGKYKQCWGEVFEIWKK